MIYFIIYDTQSLKRCVYLIILDFIKPDIITCCIIVFISDLKKTIIRPTRRTQWSAQELSMGWNPDRKNIVQSGKFFVITKSLFSRFT